MMGHNDIQDALRRLASSDGRSKAARFRDVFDDVQAALVAGATRDRVREELARHGLVFTHQTFNLMLARLRKERGISARGGGTSGSSVSVAVRPPPVPNAAAVSLPDDWRTGVLTAEQRRRLMPEQRKERDDVQREMAFPTLRPLGGK